MIAAALCSCAFDSINMTFTKVTELSEINAVIMLYILITLVIQQPTPISIQTIFVS